MSEIKVCKLIRLAKDGDHFKKDVTAHVMRTSAKIPADYIEQFNSQWKSRGQLYIVDEEATKNRNELVAKKMAKNAPENDGEVSRDQLKEIADSLGIEYAKNIKTEKLQELIDSHE